MTPEQCKGTRNKLGWSRERLSAESGVPVYVIQRIERPTKVAPRLPGDPHNEIRAALAAAEAPIPVQAAEVRILGLRPLIAKANGTPQRNRHVEVEVDGKVHDVRVKVSNGAIRLFEPLLSHSAADLVTKAVADYLKQLAGQTLKTRCPRGGVNSQISVASPESTAS